MYQALPQAREIWAVFGVFYSDPEDCQEELVPVLCWRALVELIGEVVSKRVFKGCG